MISISIYFAILLSITLYSFTKKFNILGRIIYLLYTFVALCAVVAVNEGALNYSTTFFPYIFLIIAYVIFFAPFLKRNSQLSVLKVQKHINNRYVFVLLIYCICTAITIKCFLPSVINLMRTGNWAMNRYSLYQGEMQFPYSNVFELIAMNLTDYLRLIVLVVSFALLRENKENRKKIVLAYSSIVAAVVSMLCSAIYTSSRGTIVNTFILVMAIYCFFQTDYEKNRKRYFTIIAMLGVAAVVPYIIAVTVSRFDSSSQSAVLSYFGQAPVIFNSGVWGIDRYMYGKFAFGSLFGYTEFSEASIGGTWDNGFYTFVGWLFIDWGPLGVIIIGIIITACVNRFVCKMQYSISDVYLIFFVYSTLLQGVFVIGRSYCYTLVIGIAIYFVFKVFFDKYRFRMGSILID